MVKELDKAGADKCFIPWQYVFADFAVSGLDASRQGYQSYKKVLSDIDHFISCIYIDDFTRASRDSVEWWKLAALTKRLHKNMRGASDDLDLASPDWGIKVTIYSLISRLIIKSLQEKVLRGTFGAADRGQVLVKLAVGFTRRILRMQMALSSAPRRACENRPMY